MTRMPSNKETRIQRKPNTSGMDQLREDDLQVVTGGLAIIGPTSGGGVVCLSMS